MEERTHIMLPLSLIGPLSAVPSDKRGDLLLVAMQYIKDGVTPVFSDPLSVVLWEMIRPELDADGERWNNKIAQRRYAVWCREARKSGTHIPEFEIWRETIDNGSYRMLSADNRPITEDNESYPIPNQTIPNPNIIVPTPDGAGNADKKKGKVFTPESNAYKLASLLADRIAERMPTTERADERQLQSWALDFDRCRRLDKHPWAEIEDVLEWSQEDTFWQGNILSGGKFRKQYMTLLAQMNRRAAT